MTYETLFRIRLPAIFGCLLLLVGCGDAPSPDPQDLSEPGEPRYDVVILDGRIYDGLGGEPVDADLAIDGDRIAAIGDFDAADATTVIDARGLAVAPGFINMLSWAVVSLIEDGRGLSDIRQGVTLEVFGEGWSMGPVTETMVQDILDLFPDYEFEVEWETLGEYLEHLEARGVS
ncbi:MAG: D-aminoacylase, partial [Xanthomonadales bacterium]|nr:D-aminoacylase [Xanthomonadales bacterium]